MANPHPKPGPGRPKGAVNKKTLLIKEIAQRHGPEAINMLAAMMKNKKENSGARIAAAKELLERGYGKPPQPHSGDDNGPPVAIQVSWLASRE